MSDNKKSDSIEAVLENLSKLFNTPRSFALENSLCVMCGGEARSFKDALAEKEYKLSGMCQVCQDSFFE
jgi:uncharacterized CHY-type Zn-finger protein